MNPSQILRSAWFWAHCKNCLISHAHGPWGSFGWDPTADCCCCGAAAAGAASWLEPPLNKPVRPAPIVCP